jgi:hypothetical protein
MLDKQIFIACIGFFGSIFGGLFTLLGVKMTFVEQDKRSKKQKYTTTYFISNEILPDLGRINTLYKSIHEHSINKDLMNLSEFSSEVLVNVKKLIGLAYSADTTVYESLRNIEYSLSVLIEQIDRIVKEDPDEESKQRISKSIWNIFYDLNKENQRIFTHVQDVRISLKN